MLSIYLILLYYYLLLSIIISISTSTIIIISNYHTQQQQQNNTLMFYTNQKKKTNKKQTNNIINKNKIKIKQLTIGKHYNKISSLSFFFMLPFLFFSFFRFVSFSIFLFPPCCARFSFQFSFISKSFLYLCSNYYFVQSKITFIALPDFNLSYPSLNCDNGISSVTT